MNNSHFLFHISKNLDLNLYLQRCNEPHVEQIQITSTANNNETCTTTGIDMEEKLRVEEDEEEDEEEEEEEEEFTPSAWNSALAPHRSALRSPDKTKSGVSIIKTCLL